MTREKALAEAISAALEAKILARQAREAAGYTESNDRTSMFATASAAWADVSRAYTAVAEQLPADEKPEA